ncbi:hypothetical protein [Legionella cardiaca]|uniref:Tetratricopeptide repeat protein n=1 Tax=Legionella cardiaca TaxID=1071983 RepID=A0ABY8ART7_9GAMM|nr:hypothetical protein [Legionella cardiaca]WED41872.1 hypothetical protein PXX05_07980 [Legionella cardiaca]
MPRLNQALFEKIPEKQRSFFGFYPDVFLFQDSKEEYLNVITNLTSAKYLYTDGYDIQPIGFLWYVFESFKGWLGFSNGCDTKKIQLGLYKFAYFGYLKGYPQLPADILKNQNIPDNTGFLNDISKAKTPADTGALQNSLITFYADQVEASLREGQPLISPRYAFGNAWASLDLWSEIPKLDPQDGELINRTVDHLEQSPPFAKYDALPNSKYGFAVAKRHLDKVKSHNASSWATKFIKQVLNLSVDSQRLVERAILFAPDICQEDKNFFINFYLEKKNFASAFALIEQHEDINEAVTFLLQFPKEQILAFVKMDSLLAKAITPYYLTRDTESIDKIKFVASFNSQIAQEYPAQAFRLAVAEQQYDSAYQVYEQAKGEYYVVDLQKLASHFERLGQQKYQTATEFKSLHNWREVEKLTSESIGQMKKTIQLDESNSRRERYYACMTLYAEALIERDISEHNIEDCDLTQIMKAINLLNQCKPTGSNGKKYHQLILAKSLMRQADHLIHFIPSTKENIPKASLLLKQIINLLENIKDTEARLVLGKAYFILGDLSYHFALSQDNYHAYFEAAMKTVPNNPFYILRCSGIFENRREALQNQGVPLLKELGYTVLDYYHWDNERWEKDKNPYATSIRDIHNLKVREKNSSMTLSS